MTSAPAKEADLLALADEIGEQTFPMMMDLFLSKSERETIIAALRLAAAPGLGREEEITKEMALAGRKALALVADRMETAKLTATSVIDFWQQVGHEPANEIYKAMVAASPAPAMPSAGDFDPTNHHNALKCPYCNPDKLEFSRLPASQDSPTRPDGLGGAEILEQAAKLIAEECSNFMRCDLLGPTYRAYRLADAILLLSAKPAPAAVGEVREAHEAMLEIGEQADPVREMLRRMIAEFGDNHYHTCPADDGSGPCDCFAGHLTRDARAVLSVTDSEALSTGEMASENHAALTSGEPI